MKWDIHGMQLVIRRANLELDKIIEIWNEKDGILKEADVVCLLLFRKIIEKMDAIFVLHENGHEGSTKSLARDLFENYLYLFYQINERYEYRAKAYRYQSLKSQLKNITWFMKKKGERSGQTLNPDEKSMDKKYEQGKKVLLNEMNSQAYKNIKLDWDKKHKDNKKNRGGYPTWYNIGSGKENIAELSSFANAKEEYDTIYSLLSHEVHSLNALSQITKVNEQAALTPIRDDVEKSLSLELACVYGILSIMEVVNKLNHENLDDTVDWYTKRLPKEIIEEGKLD